MTREELLAEYPPPENLDVLLSGTDLGDDGKTLYSLVRHYAPNYTLELGTRRGISAACICAALEGNARFLAVDPDPSCGNAIAHLAPRARFACTTGEDQLPRIKTGSVDFVFIDTDPHSFDQTRGWCAMLPRVLSSQGVMVFHDTLGRSQVLDAILEFVKNNPEWHFKEYGVVNGLGVLSGNY